jgi:hypothetical protein
MSAHIAHFGRQLLRTPDVPLVQPILQTQLRLFPLFCRIYLPSSSTTPLAPAEPPSAAACFRTGATSAAGMSSREWMRSAIRSRNAVTPGWSANRQLLFNKLIRCAPPCTGTAYESVPACRCTKIAQWLSQQVGSVTANTAGHRNVKFTVGSSEVDQLSGSIGEQLRYCSSVRPVPTQIGSAKSTREDCQIPCTCSVLA